MASQRSNRKLANTESGERQGLDKPKCDEKRRSEGRGNSSLLLSCGNKNINHTIPHSPQTQPKSRRQHFRNSHQATHSREDNRHTVSRPSSQHGRQHENLCGSAKNAVSGCSEQSSKPHAARKRPCSTHTKAANSSRKSEQKQTQANDHLGKVSLYTLCHLNVCT